MKELREVKEIAQARLKREEEEAEKVGLVSTVTSQPLQIFIHLQKRKAIDQQGPRSNKVNYLVITQNQFQFLLLQRKITGNDDVIDVSHSYIR